MKYYTYFLEKLLIYGRAFQEILLVGRKSFCLNFGWVFCFLPFTFFLEQTKCRLPEEVLGVPENSALGFQCNKKYILTVFNQVYKQILYALSKSFKAFESQFPHL